MCTTMRHRRAARTSAHAPAPRLAPGTALRRRRKRRPRLLTLLVLLILVLFSGAIYLLASSADGIRAYGGQPFGAPGEDGWQLTLVNDTHPLPSDFSVDTVKMPGGEEVDRRIAEPLSELLDACEQAGYQPFIRSGFRTRAEQEQILAERVQAYRDEGYGPLEAQAAARAWVAEPGTSEHELGLAVDINEENGDQDMYSWLAEHAHEYGFILRYPPEKQSITGVAHEQWHFRYVGVDAATDIWQRGITLEEYLA